MYEIRFKKLRFAFLVCKVLIFQIWNFVVVVVAVIMEELVLVVETTVVTTIRAETLAAVLAGNDTNQNQHYNHLFNFISMWFCFIFMFLQLYCFVRYDSTGGGPGGSNGGYDYVEVSFQTVQHTHYRFNSKIFFFVEVI